MAVAAASLGAAAGSMGRDASLPVPTSLPAPSIEDATASYVCVASGTGLEKACVRETASFRIEALDRRIASAGMAHHALPHPR